MGGRGWTGAGDRVISLSTHRREAPDERDEAFGCGHVGWGIAATEF